MMKVIDEIENRKRNQLKKEEVSKMIRDVFPYGILFYHEDFGYMITTEKWFNAGKGRFWRFLNKGYRKRIAQIIKKYNNFEVRIRNKEYLEYAKQIADIISKHKIGKWEDAKGNAHVKISECWENLRDPPIINTWP